ncbi:MAG: AzlC family ABC transporter permease [Acidaminococcales bacterium]|nr:AzlC family ABC transporter permease [Acidaminococcales bacterium]
MNVFSTRKILKTAWPICLGYIPLGFACGVFAQKAGLGIVETLSMCVVLYAGSGQFISIAMMMQSASALSIILTVFIVNLRHFLFSSILSEYLRGKSAWFLAAFAHETTDESFAVNLTSFERAGWTPEDAIRVNAAAHLTWTLSNAAGFFCAGLVLIDVRLAGYALTAMFIGLWSFYLSNRRLLAAGIGAGVLAVVFSLFVGYKLHIVLAAVLTSALFAFSGACGRERRYD